MGGPEEHPAPDRHTSIHSFHHQPPPSKQIKCFVKCRYIGNIPQRPASPSGPSPSPPEGNSESRGALASEAPQPQKTAPGLWAVWEAHSYQISLKNVSLE